MHILLTNDDGIDAEGLFALHKEFGSIAETVVVAPHYERSGAGHSITIHDHLRVRKVEMYGKGYGYSVTGTPADCVKIALCKILKKKPDLIVSGINKGANVATNMLYSGTVSAALEGALSGIPSIAVSLNADDNPFRLEDFSFSARFAKKLALLVQKNGLPKMVSLNVNLPKDGTERTEVVITRQCISKMSDRFECRVDMRGEEYYWLHGTMDANGNDKRSDRFVLENNKITITPIHFDLTHHDTIKELAEWRFDM